MKSRQRKSQLAVGSRWSCWPARSAGRATALAQKTELLVYTALETDQIKAYEAAFNKAYPDIELKWVRDSTGVITAKVLAEKANPQADIVIGTSASSMAVFANEGMLAAVRAEGTRQDSRAVPRFAESAALGRHGRLRRRDLLQHRRGAEAEPAQARRRGRT